MTITFVRKASHCCSERASHQTQATLSMPINSMQPTLADNVLKRKEVSGFVLEEVFDSARSKVPQHSHEAAHFCIAVSGNCVERFGNRTRECKPLSWGFFPAGETHCFEIDSIASRSFGID